MFKQNQTGSGWNEQKADQDTQDVYDPAYAGAFDAGDPEGSDGRMMNNDGDGTEGKLTADPQGMGDILARVEQMERQLADRHSHISRLEGENRALASLITSHQGGGNSPSPEEVDPPFMDDDTRALLEKQIQENPAEAVAALTEYAYQRASKQSERKFSELQAQIQERESNQQAQVAFTSQLQKAVADFGPDAEKLVQDMISSGNPATSALGSALAADPSLAKTRVGVYNLIGNLVLRGQQGQGDQPSQQPPAQRQSPPPAQASPAVPRPSGSGMSVGGEQRPEKSVEDQIGDFITQKRGMSRDDGFRKAFQ